MPDSTKTILELVAKMERAKQKGATGTDFVDERLHETKLKLAEELTDVLRKYAARDASEEGDKLRIVDLMESLAATIASFLYICPAEQNLTASIGGLLILTDKIAFMLESLNEKFK